MLTLLAAAAATMIAKSRLSLSHAFAAPKAAPVSRLVAFVLRLLGDVSGIRDICGSDVYCCNTAPLLLRSDGI